MKFHSPMIIVSDIAKSKKFYIDILNQEITQDLGVYAVLGSFSMMTREQWNAFTNDVPFSSVKTGHTFELYFEEDNLDDFVQELDKNAVIQKFTALEEMPWGQRTIRFLDPDKYVIEVAESMESVIKRFLLAGMTVQEISQKTMMPIEFIQNCKAK